MANEQLIEYINQAKQQGYSPQQIRQQLKDNQWSDTDIQQAFAQLDVSQPIDSKLPGVIDLTKRAWRLLISRIVVVTATQIITGLLTGMLVIAVMSYLNSAFTSWQETGVPFTVVISLTLVMLIAALINLYGQAAMVTALLKPELSLGETLAQSWQRFGKYAWTVWLAASIVLVGILLVIPGIIFALWFSFVLYAVFDQDLSGLKALSYSRWLIKNYLGSIIGRFILFGLILWLVDLVAAGSLSMLVELLFRQAPEVKSVLEMIISFANRYLVFALSESFAVLLYQEIKRRKPPMPESALTLHHGLFRILSVIGSLLLVGMIIGFVVAVNSFVSKPILPMRTDSFLPEEYNYEEGYYPVYPPSESGID